MKFWDRRRRTQFLLTSIQPPRYHIPAPALPSYTQFFCRKLTLCANTCWPHFWLDNCRCVLKGQRTWTTFLHYTISILPWRKPRLHQKIEVTEARTHASRTATKNKSICITKTYVVLVFLHRRRRLGNSFWCRHLFHHFLFPEIFEPLRRR